MCGPNWPDTQGSHRGQGPTLSGPAGCSSQHPTRACRRRARGVRVFLCFGGPLLALCGHALSLLSLSTRARGCSPSPAHKRGRGERGENERPLRRGRSPPRPVRSPRTAPADIHFRNARWRPHIPPPLPKCATGKTPHPQKCMQTGPIFSRPSPTLPLNPSPPSRRRAAQRGSGGGRRGRLAVSLRRARTTQASTSDRAGR